MIRYDIMAYIAMMKWDETKIHFDLPRLYDRRFLPQCDCHVASFWSGVSTSSGPSITRCQYRYFAFAFAMAGYLKLDKRLSNKAIMCTYIVPRAIAHHRAFERLRSPVARLHVSSCYVPNLRQARCWPPIQPDTPSHPTRVAPKDIRTHDAAYVGMCTDAYAPYNLGPIFCHAMRLCVKVLRRGTTWGISVLEERAPHHTTAHAQHTYRLSLCSPQRRVRTDAGAGFDIRGCVYST